MILWRKRRKVFFLTLLVVWKGINGQRLKYTPCSLWSRHELSYEGFGWRISQRLMMKTIELHCMTWLRTWVKKLTGRNHQKSPGKRRRIWSPKDIIQVLKDNSVSQAREWFGFLSWSMLHFFSIFCSHHSCCFFYFFLYYL